MWVGEGGLDVKEGWRRRGGVWRGCSPSNFICQNNKKHFFFPVQNSFFCVFSGKVEAGIEVGWMNYVFKFQVPTMHPPGALWEVRCYFRQVGFFVSAAGRENLFSSSAVLQKDESEQHLICIFSSFGMITELEVFCDFNRRVPQASSSFPR